MSAPAEYHSIVLAAGAGARFGGCKLIAPWNDGVLLDAALRAACAAPVKSVVVVTGAHADIIQDVVVTFAQGSEVPVSSARCADHALGMSASLRCGLAALPVDAAGAFIFLGDMPNIPPSVPPKLLSKVLSGSHAAIPAVNGRFGHPVLISRRLFGLFARSAGDGGGRIMLRALGEKLSIVEVDDRGILADIDTPGDLERLKGCT